jgi:hypothetical protein
MLHKSLLALLATLCLGGALTAQAAPKPPPVTITYLPFVINTPGNYVLASNLDYPVPYNGDNLPAAINISEVTSGSVTLDFKGFEIINTEGNFEGLCLSLEANTVPVTVRNGKMSYFSGSMAASQGSDITVQNMIFNGFIGGLFFSEVSNSSVSNCQFQNGIDYEDGILDVDSLGGNSYNNINSHDTPQAFIVSSCTLSS